MRCIVLLFDLPTYQAELITLNLPEFGLPNVEPTIPARVYRERMTAFRQCVLAEGYDVAIVYGDREHFANLMYLTGYDPRFEEAMLVVDLTSIPATSRTALRWPTPSCAPPSHCHCLFCRVG